MILISDGKGRGKPSLLTLTKGKQKSIKKFWKNFADQLTIEINKQNSDDIASLCGLTQADSSFDSTLRTVNVEKTKEGIGLSIKVFIKYFYTITDKR